MNSLGLKEVVDHLKDEAPPIRRSKRLSNTIPSSDVESDGLHCDNSADEGEESAEDGPGGGRDSEIEVNQSLEDDDEEEEEEDWGAVSYAPPRKRRRSGASILFFGYLQYFTNDFTSRLVLSDTDDRTQQVGRAEVDTEPVASASATPGRARPRRLGKEKENEPIYVPSSSPSIASDSPWYNPALYEPKMPFLDFKTT